MNVADYQGLAESRDPREWAIIADWYEEQGRDEEATYQRRLSSWGLALLPWLAKMAWATRIGDRTVELPALEVSMILGFDLELRRLRKLIQVMVYPIIDARGHYHNEGKKEFMVNIRPIMNCLMPPGFTVKADNTKDTKKDWDYLLRRLKAILGRAIDIEEESSRG